MKRDARLIAHGFTITELLVVIVIIGILSTFTFLSFRGVAQKATVVSMQLDLANASTRLKMFQAEHNQFPSYNHCPTPDAGEICLKFSSGNILVYSADNPSNPQAYSLDANNGDITYRINNTSSVPLLISQTPITAIANITGATQVGSVLTAGSLSPSGATITYQWQSSTTSNGTYTNIASANGNTYTLTTNELNKYLKVTASGAGSYSGTVTSGPSGVVTTGAVSATINGSFSGFANGWGPDWYDEESPNVIDEGTATFNLSAYNSGTFSAVTLSWSRSGYAGESEAGSRYIDSYNRGIRFWSSPCSSGSGFPSSTSQLTSLSTYLNNNKGNPALVFWFTSDAGDYYDGNWSLLTGMNNPSLNFTWTP